MNPPTFTRFTRARRATLSLSILAALLAGCAGMEFGAVRRAEARVEALPAGQAIVEGRIRHIVDGQPLAYHLLNKPALQIFDRATGLLLSTPEVERDGRFRWQLPAADYGVAVLFGGMAPTSQPHFRPRGGLVFVHGIVDPGLEFQPAAGRRSYIGTIEVSIESALPKDVWIGKERVFGRLLGIRVLDESAAERAAGRALPAATSLMRQIAPRGSAAGTAAAASAATTAPSAQVR